MLLTLLSLQWFTTGPWIIILILGIPVLADLELILEHLVALKIELQNMVNGETSIGGVKIAYGGQILTAAYHLLLNKRM